MSVHAGCFIADNSDMIACTVIMKDGTKLTRQFLVIDPVQIILVESAKRIGWATAKFAGVLQVSQMI